MAGPLIVAVDLAVPDFARLNSLRRAHYPPGRNHLPAHLTMFHALPPSVESEAKQLLAGAVAVHPPRAKIVGLMNLGAGVAFRVASADLEDIREEIACHFHGMLGAQDAQGWTPHVTIQNKVKPGEALALLRRLEQDFRPCELGIAGLSLHRYLGGS